MLVTDAFAQVVAAVGFNDEEKILELMTNGVEQCAIEGNWNPLIGFADICVGCDNCISLGPDIETPLAINMGGTPARFNNKWMEFHLNGPGSGCGGLIDWSWASMGDFPVIQEIVNPSQIVAYTQVQDDNNAVIRLYGDDINDLPLRTLSVAKPIQYKTLTVAFNQPSYATPITITISLTDSFKVNEELVIKNGVTGNFNYYRITAIPSTTTLTILQSSTDNEATGINIPTSSTLMQRQWEDGMLVPTILNYAMPDPDAPLVKRVTRIWKSTTKGYINLIARDTGREDGSLLAVLYPNMTETRYRRIKLARSCQWVRMRYRKNRWKLTSLYDYIPMDSVLALVYMCKSIYLLSKDQYDTAKVYEDQAILLLNKTENSKDVPDTISVQYNDAIGLNDEGNMQ